MQRHRGGVAARQALEADFYRLARRVALGDLIEARGEVFLNAAMASASWA